MNKCNMVTHVCGPPSMSGLKLVDNDCSSDGDCKPTFRCVNSKCHWTGPKHCAADQDCLQGASATYECKQHTKGAPGKHCYASKYQFGF
ncbi:hypothetical protein RvY_14735 [Ramazzottius varieornatus]|uniref:Uncharacterized protein n=1 Tax=Ramazzottius varieornatus TaxID=947166 RepID=A0A1D1VW32_RAMVA|nr:hypothetical protein RvY_14735 [Ramazzottius varieornatus]